MEFRNERTIDLGKTDDTPVEDARRIRRELFSVVASCEQHADIKKPTNNNNLTTAARIDTCSVRRLNRRRRLPPRRSTFDQFRKVEHRLRNDELEAVQFRSLHDSPYSVIALTRPNVAV